MSTEQDNSPTVHLKFIVSALQLANRRGAFELNESGVILESIKFFSSENENRSNEEQTQKLSNLVNMCRLAQKRGAFELEEASILAPHVSFFLQPATGETDGNSVNSVNVDVPQVNNVHTSVTKTEDCKCEPCECDPCECTSDNKVTQPVTQPVTQRKNLSEANAHAPPNMGKPQVVQGVTQKIEKVPPKAHKETNWNAYEQLMSE
jgi:hypothetical protein